MSFNREYMESWIKVIAFDLIAEKDIIMNEDYSDDLRSTMYYISGIRDLTRRLIKNIEVDEDE